MSENLSLSSLRTHDPRPSASGKELRFVCPFPDCGARHKRNNSHRSLSANTETGAWTCHRCGRSGILDEYRNRGTGGQGGVKRLKTANISAAPADGSSLAESVERLQNQMARTIPLRGSPGEVYMQKRGIPIEVAEAADVVFAGNWINQAAVVFQMRNEGGRLVAAMARSVCGSRKSVLGAKGSGLFATPGALAADPLIITEGPFDALSFAAAGVPAIALVGTSYPRFLKRVAALKTVIVATDNDEAGERAYKKLREELGTLSHAVHRLRMPEGCKDPNEALLKLGLEVFAEQARSILQGLESPCNAGP